MTASAPWGTVEIIIRGKRGICSLRIIDTIVENEEERHVMMVNAWREFRSMLDSCSDEPINCVAMDRPILTEGSCVEQSVVREFIDTMEGISDTGTYIRPISGKLEYWEQRMKGAIKTYNLTRVNHLYGTRFLDLYAEELEDDIDRLRRTMDVRYRKAEVVYENIMSLSEAEYKSKSHNVSDRLLKYTICMLFITAAAAVAGIFLH